MLLATWLIAHPVGEYIISPLIHINYFRYFLTPYYVAYGILGSIGVTILAGWIQKYMRNIPRWIIMTALAGAVLSTSVGMYASVWREEHLCFCLGQFFDFGYPKKSVMGGIFWLARNTHPEDVVLSEYYTGTLIPGFAGNRVYVSWWYRLIEPPTLWAAHANLTALYSGRMPTPEARAFLKRENISYVFYSETEQTYAAGKQTLDYPFLTVRYDKDGTVIYQVQ